MSNPGPIPSTFAPVIAGMGSTPDFKGVINDLALAKPEIQEISTTSATAEVGVFQRVYANCQPITLTGGVSGVVGNQTSLYTGAQLNALTPPPAVPYAGGALTAYIIPDYPYGSFNINNGGGVVVNMQWTTNWPANFATLIQTWLDVPITISSTENAGAIHIITLPAGITWDGTHSIAWMAAAAVSMSFTFKFVKAGTTAAPVYLAVVLDNYAGLTFH